MDTVVLIGELAVALGFLGILARGLIEQVQELRTMQRPPVSGALPADL